MDVELGGGTKGSKDEEVEVEAGRVKGEFNDPPIDENGENELGLGFIGEEVDSVKGFAEGEYIEGWGRLEKGEGLGGG